MKHIKMAVLAGVIAAVALLSGASWESKAQASCTSTGVPGYAYNPVEVRHVFTPPNDLIQAQDGGLLCNASDVGELWLWIDWYDTSTGVWHALNGAGQYTDYTGKLNYTSYQATSAYLVSVYCSTISHQIFRSRMQWNNWTTGVNGNQSISAITGPFC